jgi:ribosome recycling factor
MPIDFPSLKQTMKIRVETLHEKLQKFHSGRVSPQLLSTITIENDKKSKISQVGQVRIVDNNTLAIIPENKSDANLIINAVKKIDIKTNIKTVENEIYVIFPKLTQESREEMFKMITAYATEAKTDLRNIRHDFIKHNKSTTKEDEIKSNKEIQKIIDQFNAEIDQLMNKKHKELANI